jgi:deaminated glutathione amidase
VFSQLSGDTVVAVDSPFGRLGLTVCYDLRFPELYQILRFKHQAQVVMYSIFYTVHEPLDWLY